ncbi:bifunctional diguanylate cyclase/phosphodiesterase [Novosphingobium sp. NDB2Meth1]|uniref:putative bifunctional diguanylate cyclase/phosphodiesterase n=1 Tax=Novosphingobium sp. NDB2Meth1 TaxID=1892847 RepID=UPI0009F8B80A|nr:EAL domain-containing protein [Novosphingobium sp. NDB2Meth1]
MVSSEPRSGVHGRARRWLRGFVRSLRCYGRHWQQRPGDAFTEAYALSVSHRAPLLYLVVVFNTLLVASCFYGTAPRLLVLMGPVLSLVAVQRAWHWMPDKVAGRPVEGLRSDLDGMQRLGGWAALLFVAWSLGLYPYGDPGQRELLHFVIAVTMFSAVLGMANSPQTALRLGTAFTLPWSLFLLASGHPDAVPIALAQVFITVILLAMTQIQHRDFVRLELSRQLLVRRERQTAELASAHYRQATVDHLTGGRNRRAILDSLEEHLAAPHDVVRPWLALFDLDGFKHVNDTYGHAAGDHVLRTVNQRIGLIEGVTAHGRLGGDEFAILFDGAFDAEAVVAAARVLSLAIRQPIPFNGATLRLFGSIGLYRADGDTVSHCLERADAALYKAKELGDGAIAKFGPHDEVALQRRIAVMRQFNDCPLEDRLRLLYQPIFDCRDGRVVGMEALARWSPDGIEWQTPGEFLAIADATGRTGELTRLVLARTLAECRPWETGLEVSINLAARDVVREGMAETIAAIVEDAGASPASVMLEVTERALQIDPRRAAAQLAAFRDRGFRIALDDFGAGWSSLSQLRDLPLDRIKLDRALVGALSSDPGARAVTGMIVALAWQLGIGCSIEGVESEAQADAARALGIHLMQGYHFARPEPAVQALRLYAGLLGPASAVGIR